MIRKTENLVIAAASLLWFLVPAAPQFEVTPDHFGKT